MPAVKIRLKVETNGMRVEVFEARVGSEAVTLRVRGSSGTSYVAARGFDEAGVSLLLRRTAGRPGPQRVESRCA